MEVTLLQDIICSWRRDESQFGEANGSGAGLPFELNQGLQRKSLRRLAGPPWQSGRSPHATPLAKATPQLLIDSSTCDLRRKLGAAKYKLPRSIT
jgi:hypothetical protein